MISNRSLVLRRLPIHPKDFVVEIGAGPIPFMYTKLILDKYPFDNIERHGDIVNVAPVIKADAVKMPLADKSCDVLFVSHVLEHLEDPARFIQEARRCARYIYLEFPTLVRELMYAWSFHKWLVEVQDGRLVFYKNDIPQLFGGFFHGHYDFLLDLWSEHRFEELNHHLYVNVDELAYTISSATAMERVLQGSAQGDHKINYRSQYGEAGTGKVKYGVRVRLKMLTWAVTPEVLIRMRNRVAQKHNGVMRQELTEAIVGRLLCQKCRKGSLRLRGDAADREMICERCSTRYVESRGIFDLDV